MKGQQTTQDWSADVANSDAQDLWRVLAKFAPLVLPSIGDRPDWSWMNDGGVVHELQPQVFPIEQTLREGASRRGTCHASGAARKALEGQVDVVGGLEAVLE